MNMSSYLRRMILYCRIHGLLFDSMDEGFMGILKQRFLVDGRFSRAHGFEKPNDLNALNLMNTAAKSVMRELSSDIILAYGDSDEYR